MPIDDIPPDPPDDSINDTFSEAHSWTNVWQAMNETSLSDVVNLLKLQIGSQMFRILYPSQCGISLLSEQVGKIMSLWRNDEMEVQTRIFQFWVRPFHWNFAQYLPAYLQW